MRRPLYSAAWIAGLVAAGAVAAPLPPGVQQGRFASPTTTFAVQPDSIFAPVVAATPALRVVTRRGAGPPNRLPSDVTVLTLTGPWRFQLESTSCPDDDTCEGIAQGWYQPDFDDSGWRTLAVPGHFTRQIPVDELGGRASALPFNFAWYRRAFDVPPVVAGGHLRLVFEAADYRADVWLDGVRLTTHGAHVGTFNPFAFDLPPLDAQRPHVLAVRIQKPLQSEILSCGAGTGPATDLKTVIDGTKGYWDGRPGGNDDNFDPVTKQSLHTGGIVRPVLLRGTGAVRLDWVFVTAMPAPRRRGRVLLSYTLTNLDAAEREVTLATAVSGPGLERNVGVRATVRLHPGPNRVELPLRLARVSYWFPAGHPGLGGPAMYTAATTVADGARISDQRTDRFGIRALAMASDRCEDRFAGVAPDPACGDRFGFTAPRPPQGTTPATPLYQRFFNGKRVFLAGAGTDPDPWVASIDRAAADRHMALVRQLNGNHLGVAVQIAPPVFYDAADDAGIAIVQDFELQWTYNDNDLVFGCANGNVTPAASAPGLAAQVLATAQLLAADQLYLFYNHPSIVQWVMHNEPTWELAEVLGPVFPPIALLKEWDKGLDRALVAVATGIDQTRPVHAGAGRGDTHEYTGYLLCSYHDLLGLDPARAICNAQSTESSPFPSEFGAHVWPFSAKRWMAPDALFPADASVRRQTFTDANPLNPNELVPWLREWLYHTSTVKTTSVFVGSPADYDRFQDFALASQLYQSAFLKFHIEHYRKDKYRPTAGLRFFILRGMWDQGYYDVFDQYDLPSASVPAVRDAYAPLLVTSEVTKPLFAPDEAVHLPVWIVNDGDTPLRDAQLAWTIRRVSDAYVLRGVRDSPSPPYQDARRVFLGLAGAAPPPPGVTALPRPGATTVGDPLVEGGMTVSVDADGVSPPGGETAIDFTAPGGSELLRTYLLELTVTQNGNVLATNQHLIAVAAPTWEPPPGLSDGTTAYGEEPGEHPLRFALRLTGLAADQAVTLEVPQFGGATEIAATGTADAEGRLAFPALTPDEYVVRAGDAQVAHLTLTRDTDLALP